MSTQETELQSLQDAAAAAVGAATSPHAATDSAASGDREVAMTDGLPGTSVSSLLGIE